jgi:hypothetical protein
LWIPRALFWQCPQHDTPGASAIFYKNLFAHKPHLRKRPPLPSEMISVPPPSTQSFSSPANFPPPGCPPHPPPSQAASPSVSSSSPGPSILKEAKKAKFLVQFVKSFSTHIPCPPPILPPMPIAIDNGLPHIAFDLGSDASLDPSLSGFLDTCGALNTGYLLFHLWLMSERPDLVAEFVSFDDSNPFEPIKLGGAICDPADFDSSNHGNLTPVVRYYTPYLDTGGSPITISFALGSDVTVNTIFGLPMLCDLDSVNSLRTNSMHSHVLGIDFPITRAAATFGLPQGCLFDPDSASRNHSSTCGLGSAAAAPISDCFTAPAFALAVAIDDMSLDFLQRTVHPSSL